MLLEDQTSARFCAVTSQQHQQNQENGKEDAVENHFVVSNSTSRKKAIGDRQEFNNPEVLSDCCSSPIIRSSSSNNLFSEEDDAADDCGGDADVEDEVTFDSNFFENDDISSVSSNRHHLVCDIGKKPFETAEKYNSSEKQTLKSKSKRRRKRFLGINLTNCKYDCVRRCSKRFGFRSVDDTEDWTLFWTDYSVSLERVMDMKKYQKINHFPGMSEICRKDLLARNMNRLWKQFPKDYAIFPRTWCLPADFGDFQAFCRTKKNKTFILKPDSGSQGKGIFLTKNPKILKFGNLIKLAGHACYDITNVQDIKPGEDLICQQYVARPFLIDSFKFDLRIYVLVTSCDPLRIFLFNDGLGRFTTVQYSEPTNNNLENIFMHLTNYAIQKNSDDFVRDEESGSKRRLSVINKWFSENGYDVKKIWDSIDDVVIKTLISAHPILKHNYRTCFPNHVKGSACFEILGFDILLDRKLKPWVLEVNHSPSFTTDSPLDREIKDKLIYDTLVLVNFSSCDKRKYIEEEKKKVRERLLQKMPREARGKKEENDVEKDQEYLDSLQRYEDSHIGNFRRIYPEQNEEKYASFFANSCSLFQETAASKARSECARLQREEIKLKSQEIECMRRKNGLGGGIGIDEMRPESGKMKRKTVFKRLTRSKNTKQKTFSGDCDLYTPMLISERDEIERIGMLMQRENLLKTLGIPDFIYRLLNGTKSSNKVRSNQRQEMERKVDTQSYKISKSLPAMKTYSAPSSGCTKSDLPYHYNEYSGTKPVQARYACPQGSDNAASSTLYHWQGSGPPSLTRRDRQILASAGINFSTLSKRKVLPKRTLPFSKFHSFDSDSSDVKSITNRTDQNRKSESFDLHNNDVKKNKYNQSIRNCFDYIPTEKNQYYKSLEKQMSCGVLESSPPIKIFSENINHNRNHASFNAARGLSIISSPAPIQCREDSVSTLKQFPIDSSTPETRSTKAQRARGASNTIRLRQMELLESRATLSF